MKLTDIKVGEIYKVKKSAVCGNYNHIKGDSIKVTDFVGVCFFYDILRNGKKVDDCFNCLTSSDLLPIKNQWKVGDVLTSGVSKVKILKTRMVRQYKTSFADDLEQECLDEWQSKQELVEDGWKLQEKPQIVEKTMDEIAELVGCDVKNLKIKK